MVTFRGASRFFSRTSAGKYQLDVDEIRNAVLAADSQGERIRRFLQDRISQIRANETPAPLVAEDRVVLHVIPVQSFLRNDRIGLTDEALLARNFKVIYWRGGRHRYNIDGFLDWEAHEVPPKGVGYCQLFHNGVVEAVANAKQDHEALCVISPAIDVSDIYRETGVYPSPDHLLKPKLRLISGSPTDWDYTLWESCALAVFVDGLLEPIDDVSAGSIGKGRNVRKELLLVAFGGARQ